TPRGARWPLQGTAIELQRRCSTRPARWPLPTPRRRTEMPITAPQEHHMPAFGRVRILGPVEVWAGERRVELGGSRQLSLLSMLVLSAGKAVSVDALIEALWPAENSSLAARKRLQMTVARLRQALQPITDDGRCELRTVGGGYLLALAPDELDAE